MSVTTADILSCSGHPVQRITLRLHGTYAFEAGQYLYVKGPGLDIPLSIASSPSRLPELELHYQSTPGLTEASVMDQLLTGDALSLSEPQGNVTWGQIDEPLLIIAGGSGAAQAFSCAEHRALHQTCITQILWCADVEDETYETDRLSRYANGKLTVCVDNQRTPQNQGLSWLRAHCKNFLDHRVVLSGSPAFVYTVTDLLLSENFAASQMHADAYTYAPRG